MNKLAAFLIMLVLATTADACVTRHRSARVAFVRAHACPTTGLFKLPCPGYVVDHIVPLCAHGPDVPGNMQWQNLGDSKAKDILERRQCRRL